MGKEEKSSATPSRSLGERMLHAEFPHPVDQPELIETHISWVILTGRFAYKIKKPLKLDFLDYSTLRLRKKYCDRELQINKVWAEAVYIDVVPIYETATGLRVAASDEQTNETCAIVDYAVRMNQFPQSSLLAEQLKEGTITPGIIEPLGEQLAKLHQQIDSVPYHESLVREGAIDPAIENCDYLLGQLSPSDPDHDRAEKLKEWTRESIKRLQPLMERRAKQGFVKSCHGDLHLGNILFLNDQFIPFDGVEFNDAFSQIEGLDEIAFLGMELDEHGYGQHARRLINRYLESTGDYEGLLLLRYFLVYRAMVRAKVDMIRQSQRLQAEAASSQSSHPNLSPAGRRYLDYAESVLKEPSPELWITYGLSGSGKSTASNKVVQTRGYFRVRSDVQRKLIACRDPCERTSNDELSVLYSSEMTQLTYQRLWTIADQVLQSGFGVIVDATFLQRDVRVLFQELAAQHHVPFHILVCEAKPDELALRLASRAQDPSDADASVLESQMKYAQPPTEAEAKFVIPAMALH